MSEIEAADVTDASFVTLLIERLNLVSGHLSGYFIGTGLQRDLCGVAFAYSHSFGGRPSEVDVN